MSSERHTGPYLAEKINAVIKDINPRRIAAIVSDSGANVNLARSLVKTDHKHIINLRCISHCLNLISKDIIKNEFADRLVKRANIITTFFKKSHLAHHQLSQIMEDKNITGGGLKTYVPTRWITTHEATESIVRLRIVLQEVYIELLNYFEIVFYFLIIFFLIFFFKKKILQNHSNVITNESVKAILRRRGYFEDTQALAETLKPIRIAIQALESKNTTMADCYIHLIKIAIAIKSLPSEDYRGFRNHCIKVFNERLVYLHNL